MTRQNFRRRPPKRRRRVSFGWLLLFLALGTAAFASTIPPVGPGNNNGNGPPEHANNDKDKDDCGKGHGKGNGKGHDKHGDCDDPSPAPSPTPWNPYPPQTPQPVQSPKRRPIFVSDYSVGGGHPRFDGARVRDLLGAD